ncbi:hypothetical protein G6F57_017845 [Rhizopus arrhizus]|nr:hypothetical protein G6F65_020115 [Rhizopus arrhizus]KAG1444332.1 hypothetical protein G6F57_017845 [Rhizopus arrhizus]
MLNTWTTGPRMRRRVCPEPSNPSAFRTGKSRFVSSLRNAARVTAGIGAWGVVKNGTLLNFRRARVVRKIVTFETGIDAAAPSGERRLHGVKGGGHQRVVPARGLGDERQFCLDGQPFHQQQPVGLGLPQRDGIPRQRQAHPRPHQVQHGRFLVHFGHRVGGQP